MTGNIRIISYGLGSIGGEIAKFILEKKGLEIVGAIDTSKEKIGKDLGILLGLDNQLNITVSEDAETLFSQTKADLVIHATSSYFKETYPQLMKCVKNKLNIISTCEELVYPYLKYPKLASKLDKLAKINGVTVLGTGINPGYLMDTLPIILTGPCKEVTSVKVVRLMYSGNRRWSYQKKIGTGLAPTEFKKMIGEGTITGHVGLAESIAMVAAALGWNLEQIRVLPPKPIISRNEIKTTYTIVHPGQVGGVKSEAYGLMNRKKAISLRFVSHVNVKKPYDQITIKGIPDIQQKISGGINGDSGTVAIVVNAIPKVLNAQVGLITMKEIPVLSATTRDMRTYLVEEERRRGQ